MTKGKRLADLCIRADQNAWAKGFLDEERTWPSEVILFHSELSEALEDYRANRGLDEVYYEGEKPCGIRIELADFVIRVAQSAGTREMIGELLVGFDRQTPPATARSFEQTLAATHYLVSDALLKGEMGDIRLAYEMLGGSVGVVFNFAGNELWSAIELKEKYNATRLHRHGGKKL